MSYGGSQVPMKNSMPSVADTKSFNKMVNTELQENYVAYTDHGFNGKRSSALARQGVIRNRKLADGKSATPEVDANELVNLRKLREKQNPNEYMAFTNGSIYEYEQRFVPYYTGRIYGFRVPEKVRKYREEKAYGHSAGLAGMSQFPDNFTRRSQLAQRIASSQDGEI